MATISHRETQTRNVIFSTQLVVGLGIFNVTPDFRQVDRIRSYRLSDPFRFEEYEYPPTSDNLRQAIASGQSFLMNYSHLDLALANSGVEIDHLKKALPQGYKKIFILNVTRDTFEAQIWKMVGRPRLPGHAFPDPQKHGFLGAMWIKQLTSGELFNAATQSCLHKCNPPAICRQTGCFCSTAHSLCF